MKKNSRSKTKRTTTRSVLRLLDLEHAKSAVLNSLTSSDAQRGYRHAIDEFVDWYCSEPRLALNRTVVLRYRSHLESRQLAPGTINLRLGAKGRVADKPDGVAHGVTRRPPVADRYFFESTAARYRSSDSTSAGLATVSAIS